jgi:hypothetical protein
MTALAMLDEQGPNVLLEVLLTSRMSASSQERSEEQCERNAKVGGMHS